jgi:formylglycine-generating enzyme
MRTASWSISLHAAAAALALTAAPIGLEAADERPPGCDACPEMVVVPPGRFTIGSPDTEPGRGADEAPRRVVTIAAFELATREVTRAEYARFVAETKRPTRGGCITDRAKQGDWQPHAGTTWRDPGFSQGEDHPALCVSWNDAQAYIAWLDTQGQGGYRLPTEAEWEYAARAGSTTAYPWGDEVDDGCADANAADATLADKYPGYVASTCRDGALNTSRAGAYRANAFGLHDLIGNTSEWVEDCATMSYEALPDDGRADTSGDCASHIVRGGSWGTMTKDYRVANRMRYAADALDDSIGFRVARTLR